MWLAPLLLLLALWPRHAGAVIAALDQWETRAVTGAAVGPGGSLVTTSDSQFLYALRGNNTPNFDRYDTVGDSWTPMANVPNPIGQGGALVYPVSGSYLYVFQGNNTDNFFRYDMGANTWAPVASPSATISGGGSLASTGDNYIYALRGNNTNMFYRYDINTNAWIGRANLPQGVGEGAELIYPGTGDFLYAQIGNNTNNFFRYSITQDQWSPLPLAPGPVSAGGSGAYPGKGGYLFFHGNGMSMNRYDILSDSWTGRANSISNFGIGGSLAYAVSGDYLYALDGNTTTGTERYSAFWTNEHPPDTPVNATPTSGSTGVSVTPQLSASVFSDADGGHTLANSWWQVSLSPSFLITAWDSLSASAGSINVNVAVSLNSNTTYYWRVAYKDSNSTWSNWSQPTPFVTGTGPPPQIGTVQDSPNLSEDISVQASPHGLVATWNLASGAVTEYSVSVGTSAGATDVVASMSVGLSTTAYISPSAVLTNGLTYYVNVVGRDGVIMGGLASSNGVTVTFPTLSSSALTTADQWSGDVPSALASNPGAGAKMVYPGSGDFLYGTFGGGVTTTSKYGLSSDTFTATTAALTAITTGGIFSFGGSSDYLYHFPGMSTNFERYRISTNAWNTMPVAAPCTVGAGSGLGYAATQGQYLWLLCGNGSQGFQRYDVSNSLWLSRSNAPSPPGAGAGVYWSPLSPGVFIVPRGGGSPGVDSYAITSNSWGILASAPANIGNGSQGWVTGNGKYLYLTAGGGTDGFFRYDVLGNTWLSMSAVPGTVNGGGMGAYIPGAEVLYVARGGDPGFYRYLLATDQWDFGAKTPPQVFGLGGSLAYSQSAGLIYGLRAGGTNNFYEYSISANVWTTKANLPVAANSGASLAAGSGDVLYALAGGTTTGFYAYSTSIDTWTARATTLGNIVSASGMAYVSTSNLLYTFAGLGSTTFYQYDVASNTWNTMAAAPLAVDLGASLVYPGTGDYLYAERGNAGNNFWRYSISTNTWYSLTNIPTTVQNGGALVYPGTGDYIYLQRGQSTTGFYRYSISTDTWSTVSSVPGAVGDGGALVYPGTGDYIYGMQGGGVNAFRKYGVFFTGAHPPDTPANSLPTSGSVATSTAVTLTASAYADTDAHAHSSSHWVVSTSPEFSGSQVIYDSGAVAAAVTHGVTVPSTGTFYWRVRYQDNTGAWSNWSHPTPFSGPGLFSELAYGGAVATSNDGVWGDWDSDGDYDYARAPGGATRVEVRQQNAGNTFAQGWQRGGGAGATDNASRVLWADVDNDNDLDYIVSHLAPASGALRVYKYNAGTLSTTPDFSSAETNDVNGLAVGDVTGDGLVDIVAGTANTFPVRVYANSAATPGSFTLAWSSAETDNTQQVVLGDHDNDGDLDLSVSNNGNNRTYRNEWKKGQFFVLSGSSALSEIGSDLEFADVDNNGYLDVITTTNQGGGMVRVFTNVAGLYTNTWSSTNTDTFKSVAAGDLDGDGDMDLAVTSTGGSGKIYAYENNGAGSFSQVYTSSTSANWANVSLADYDGDKALDILATNSGGNDAILINNNVFTNTAPTTPSISNHVNEFSGSVKLKWGASSDDHTPAGLLSYNLRVGTTPGGRDVMSEKIAPGPGNAGSGLSWSLTLSAGASTKTYYWSVQAVDNTGWLTSSFAAEDVFVVNPVPYSWSWEFASNTQDVQSVKWGDMDGDNDLDFVAAEYGQPVWVWTNNGAGSFNPGTNVSGAAQNARGVDLADFDGDGDLDVAVANSTATANTVFRNNGGAYSLYWTSPEAEDNADVAWGDFDRDGDPDLLFGNENGAQPSRIYRNDWNLSGSFTLAYTTAEMGQVRGLDVGDLDGDDDLDFVLSNQSTGIRDKVYLNTGDSFAFVVSDLGTEMEASEDIVLADQDGDGDLEAFVSVTDTGLRVYQNNGLGVFTSVFAGGAYTPSYNLDVADVDMDGDNDVVMGALSKSRQIFRNDGGAFTPFWPSDETDEVGEVAFADVNSDGRMDFLAAGNLAKPRVYQNILSAANAAPTVPALTAEPDAVSGSIKLEWAAATDAQTPAALLTYHLRVGVTPGGNEVMSSKIATGPGNMGQALSHTIALSAGAGTVVYYWSVKAVDNSGYLSSAFAAEDSFILSQGPFISVWNSAETESTRGAAWGDTDGDGDLDLLAGNDSGQADRLYRNDGGGTFTSVWTSVETDSAYSIALGDYDNDGDLDQLVGNNGQANRIYRNDGGNTFTLVWSEGATYTWSTAVWGDVDNDGDLDFAQADSGASKKVFRNDGGGGFTQAWASPDTDNSLSIAWGDYDGDGDLDLLAGNAGQNKLYRNDWNISGSLTLAWTSPEGEDSTSVAWGDSDGDGDLDQLVGNGSNQNNRLYRNDGNNTFTSVWTSPEAEYTYSVQWGDYDGDGDLDQFVANSTQANRIYRNDGGNAFTAVWNSAETEQSFEIAVGDYDGDGDMDQYVGNWTQTNRVYRNNLNPANAAPTTPALTAEPDGLSGSVKLEWAAATDAQTPAALLTYNLRVGITPGGGEVMSAKIPAGPGNTGQSLSWSLNLSASTGTRTYYWSVQTMDNTGFLSSSFAAEDSFVLSDSFGAAWATPQTDNSRAVDWGDTDGDGDADFAIGNFGQPVRVYRNDGANAFTMVWSSTETDLFSSVRFGDFDGDGDLDLQAGAEGQPNRVYRNDGGNSFSLVWSSPETDSTRGVAWGDVDNDGDLDLIAANQGQANRVYRNDWNVSGSFTLHWSSTELDSSLAVSVGDMDADGDQDMFIGNGNQALRAYSNNGDGTFALAWTGPAQSTAAVALGDSDGDGDLDALVTNDNQVNRVYRNDGAYTFTEVWASTETDITYGAGWADFDGDGDLDHVAANQGGQADRVYRNNGGNSFSLFWVSIQTEDTLAGAWADSDGDGDADYLAANTTATVNRLYVNNLNPANTAPTSPTLVAEADGVSGSVKLEWNASTDTQTTDADLLTYNLRVGITPGGNEVMSAKIAAGPGNVGHPNVGAVLSWSLMLSGSAGGTQTYYWSVQAVDNTGFLSSGFAAEDSFVIKDTFGSVWNSAETENTQTVAWGDYDNDGDLDQLAGNDGQTNRVYRNDGGNVFTAVWNSVETEITRAVAWGDYDGDGDLDQLVGNNGQTNRIYRNDGAGSFTAVWNSVETDATKAVAWGDYDNDGDLDQLAGNYTQPNRIYRNDWNVSTSFTLVWSSAESDNTIAAAWGDYDGDGDLDQLVGNDGGANRVYRNDGGGVFALVWSSAETENTFAVIWGDYDGDGDLDQLVGNYNQTNRVYRNDGGGVFTPVWNSTETESTFAVVWGDHDGDGDLDQLVANYGQPNHVYRNDGGNIFTLVWSSVETENAYAAAWGDSDGDGDLDQLVGNYTNQTNRVYGNNLILANTAPTSPTLVAEADGLSGSYKLEWNASTDTQTTDADLLTYNLRVGITPGGNEVMSSKIAAGPGNVGHPNVGAVLSWSLMLSGSASGTQTYYWSVQAVDNTGFLSSGFAAEDSFVVNDTFGTVWNSAETEITYVVALGDSDGDGDLDQLAGNYGQTNRVYRNDGGGVFTAVWNSVQTEDTKAVAWGDYDGDGDLDQLAGNWFQTNRVYRNDGGNAFTAVWSSAETENTAAVAWGDYDNDGDLDQLVGNDGQTNRVYRNDWNVSSSFTPVWSSVETDATRAVAWGDYDSDGDLDQLVGNWGQANRVYRNDGGGAFTAVWASAETDNTSAVTWGDSDGDGDLDQLVGNFGQSNRVYRNDGGGVFTLAWSSTETESTSSVTFGDYDGDGDLDQMAGNFGQTNRVYRNDGGNAFSVVWSSVQTENTSSAAWADTDADGDMDQAVGNDTQTNRVYRNNLNPTNAAPTAPGLTAEPDAVSGSVKLEWTAGTDVQTPAALLTYNLRVGVTPGGNEIMSAKIAAGPGNVGQAISHSLNLSASTGTVTYYWSVQAVDNTGYLSSAFAAEDSFVISQGAFISVWNSAELENSTTVAWGDSDGDGDLDQLVGNYSATNRVYRNDGGNVFTAVWNSAETEATTSVVWGDYDGDGDLDQLVGNYNETNRVYRNNGGNTFTAVWNSAELEATTSVAWGDYDDDGDLDQLVGNANQTNRIYRNDGGNVFTAVWNSAELEDTTSVAWGDSDGDGDLDQLIGNNAQVNRVYRNDGGGTFTAAWASAETDGTQSLAWGDHDGDGDLDQLVGNTIQPNRVYRNDGGNTFSLVWTSVQTETNRSVAWGDYDGDGDLDQLVANISQINRVYRNDGGNAFTAVWSSDEAEATYAVVWGDSDGDGDMDQLVGNYGQTNRVYRNNLNPANTAPAAVTLGGRPDTVSGAVLLSWSASTDTQTADADLLTYNLRVGITPGGHEVMSAKIPTGPGNVGQGISHSLNLSDSGTARLYYWSVQAVDNTGFLSSAFAAEDSFWVDGTAPTGLTTINELSATVDLDWTSSLDTLSASWSAAADGETGLAFYSVSIGTTPGGADTYAWTSVGTATSHIATGLTLLSGSVYYFNVRAANILGVMTAILSADGVTVDNAAPWGGAVSHANEWRNAATAAGDTPIGYTVPNDGGAGVTLSASHTLERGSATLTTGSCGAYGGWTTVTSFNGAAGATGTLTDSFNLVADNCYQWRVVFRDDVDNPLVLTASQEIRVDTAPPTCAFTVLSESATTTWVAGSTLYFSNSASTSFAVEYSLNDNHSVDAVGFPALGAPLNNFTGSGMDNSSPYSGTYNIGPTTLGMQDPVAGANIPTCSDSAGNTYTPVTNYGVSEDSSGPTGGAISHLNGWISASDLINDNTIDYTIGTDAVSGISAVSGNQHTLQRLVATMTSGSCGAYALDDPNINSFAAAASATGSFTDTYNLLADKCYKWQIIMRDNVGNETTLSASSVLQTDNAPPHTCNVSALSDSGLATYVTGNTVWYGNGGASTFSASVAMADNHSAVSVSFPLLAGPFSNVTGSGIDTTGPFEQSYGTGAATSGSEDPLAGGNVPFCVDAAGNTLTATNSYSLRQDTTPPNLVAATVGHFNGWLSASELTTDITVSYTIGTDAGAGITSGNGNEHRLWRRVATLAAGACGGYADDAMVLTFPDNAGAAGNVVDTTNLIADRCYTWEIENVDNVSNSARVNTGDVIKTDSAAPATCQVSGVTTAGQFTWVNGVTGHYSTLGSGTFDVTYTGTDNQVFGDITFPVVAGGFANVTGGPTTDTTATYSQSYGVSATTTGSENPVAGANQPVCHDQSGNPTTATTNWALVSDTAAPTGGAISAPNSWTQTPAADNTIYYTMGQDVGGNNAGIVSVSFNTHTLKRMVAPLTAGSCGVYVDEDPAVSVFAADALSESSVVDTDDLASDVCYKWQLTMVDNVGNATTVTTSQTLLVDTSGPATCFFETVTDATTYTWVSASQEVYYSNLGPGNFTVSYSGSDAQSFAGINFPALAGGFTNVTGTGTDTTYPFQQTYSTSAATTGTETPVAGVNLPVCSDSASNTTAATTNYALIADNTGPTGGSISHLNLYTADLVSTRTISFSVGTDSGAGISQTSGNPHVIQRFVAPLTGDSCGAFVVDDANVVTFNADALSASDITDPDALVADNCYTYHMIMADNVGNTTIVSSGQFIRTDTTAPDTCNYVTVSDSTNVTWVSGSQVFYSALGAGAYSASFTGTDAHSFSHIIFPTLGGVFTNVTGNGNDFLAPYENLYATSAITTGTEDPLAGANRPVCVDMAANTTPAATNYSLIADNTGPTSGSVAHADLWQKNLSADNTITYNVGEDVGATNAGVHSTSANTHVVQRLVANLASGACGAYGVDDSNVATFFADALSGSTTVDPDDLLGDRCYKWQMVQADSVGNTTIVSATQSIRTDTSGPDTCTVSAVSDSTLYTWVTGTKAFYSNLGAGSVQVTYSGSDLQQYSHTEFPALSDSVFVNVSGSAVIYAPGPYTASFTTGPSSTGTQDPVAGLNRPVCWDTSANTTTATGNWSLIRDIVPPTGGATTYLSGFTNNLSQDITISYSVGLDSGAANAGIHSTSGWLQDIQRGEATMTAGSCGAYAWNTITSFAADAFSSSQFVDTADMAANRCYQWRLMQRDDVGNAAPTTPTLTLYTDTTQPSSCTFVTATKTSLNTWVNGSTVFYSNQGAGSFQIESTGTDVHSFSHIIFPTLGAPITNISGSGTDNAPAYTVSYTTGANSFGDASPVASRPTCVDKAGNGLSASTHFNLTRDITDPTGGTVTHFNGWQNNNLADQTVNYVIATDAGAGITAGNGNGHTLQRLVAPLSAGNCGAFAMDNTFVLSYSAATAQAGSVIDPYDRLSAKCYTWQIVMKDNVGNNVTRTTTDITKVDTSAPTAVSQLKDGLTATDEFYASSNNTLYANWQPGADAESGTVFYSYSIGTSPGLTNVVNWTDVSTSTSVTRTGLTLTLGATYYVNVRSGNNAITAGPVMSTNGVLVDNTVPSISFVNDGPGTDIDYQGSPEVLNANWAAAVAGPGGIREYSLSVGTSPGATNFIPWTNIGIATSWTSSSLPLQNGSTYYVNVRSVTNAGIVGPVRSTDGTLIDSVQPTIPFVNDGTLSGSADDLDYTRQLTTLSATWADPVVGPSGVAGVIEYSYSIGTSPGLANVVPWTSNGLSKTVTRSNLTLVDGTIYVVSVRVTNPAMVTSPVRHSDGILADVTPPPLTLTSPPAGYLTRVTSIPVTGTTESGTGVVVVGNGVNVPVTLGAVSGSVTVSEGLQVFTVVATDPSGNVTTVTRSIRVDLTLPQVALGSPAANTQTTPIGGILNILATVSDDVAVATVKVEYGPGATPTAYKQIGTTTNGAVNNQTIAQWDTTTLTGLYTLRLTGADTAGNTRVLTRQIYITNQLAPPVGMTLVKNAWHLFSVPGQPVPSDPKKFISGKYNVRRWNPLTPGVAPLYNYSTEFTAGPGQGFWVRTYDQDVTLSFAYNAQDSTQNYSLTLYNGWNMIGTPFNRSMPVSSLQFRNRATNEVRSFSSAVLAGWLDSVMWGYAGGTYVQVTDTGTLAPYSAYFLKLNENLDMIVNPAGGDPSGVARIVRKPLPVHRVGVSATQQGVNGRVYADVDNHVGLMHTAVEGRDVADAEEPPPTEDYLMVFAEGVDTGGKQARLASNYKAASLERGKETLWTVSTRTNQQGPVSVNFSLLNNENDAFLTHVTDLSSGEVLVLSAGAPLRFDYAANPAEGQVEEKTFLVKATRLGGALSAVSHSFETGWRLVSFPIDAVPTKAALQLGDDVKDPEIYQYYESVFTQVGKGEDVDLQAGLGFWLRLPEAAELDLEGVLPDPAQAIELPLVEGWNLIGNPFDGPLAWGDNIQVRHNASQQIVPLSVAVENGWIKSPLYQQSQEGAGYETTSTLQTWAGYFLLSQGNLTLLLKR